MTFEIFCMTIIALFIGMAVCFNGYRWFLILLPIFGFVFGFGLGAQTVTALFGVGFLSTVTSWVVGFIVALIFAVLSYLFYFIGVALVAGSFGYSLGVAFMGLFGFDLAFVTWLVGVVLGIIFAFVTLALNIQKWVVIGLTSFSGAGVIIGSFLFAFGKIDPSDIGRNAVGKMMQDSPFWLISFLVLGILGFVTQYYVNKSYQWEIPENRV
jgi:hypothetical protein